MLYSFQLNPLLVLYSYCSISDQSVHPDLRGGYMGFTLQVLLFIHCVNRLLVELHLFNLKKEKFSTLPSLDAMHVLSHTNHDELDVRLGS